LRFVGRCFRAHDPAWSFTPLSGTGADLTGGRFNRKGEPTLYLSCDVVTAVGECTQGFTRRLQPLTICEYDIDCADVADLHDDAARTKHGVSLDHLECAWLSYQLAGKQAPSWLAADQMKGSGHSGIIVPSFVPGATEANRNLVLWRWGPDLPYQVTVFDPNGRLPANQLAWPLV
jgi:RES domain-containing protein